MSTRTRSVTESQRAVLRAVATGRVYVFNNGTSPQRELRQPTYVALMRLRLVQPNGNVRTVAADGRTLRRLDLSPAGLAELSKA